jgi:beta-galactosidase
MAVFSAAASVELKVNGVSLGKKPVPRFGVVYYDALISGGAILFKPGKLEATSWDAAGNILATSTVATTKPAIALKLSLDQPGIDDMRVSGPVGAIKADGQDVALVRVQVVDTDGKLVPSAGHNISFSITGPGAIYGVGNGDPSDHDPDKAEYRKAYKGMARVIVQSATKTVGGEITLSATAGGLAKGSVTIKVS